MSDKVVNLSDLVMIDSHAMNGGFDVDTSIGSSAIDSSFACS